MRSLTLPLAAAVLLVAALVALQLLPSQPPTPAERAQRIAAELRCPDCQALSVAESRTRAAAAIRAEVESQVAAGRSDAQIRDHFVARYGTWILLAPPDPLAWWLPLGGVLLGLAAFAIWLRAGRGAGEREPGRRTPTAEERARLTDELEALDG